MKKEKVQEQDFVCSFPRNEKEQIRFSIRNYKGRGYLDIRLWFQKEKGEWSPTKKGVVFPAERFSDFKKAVEEIEENLPVLEKASA